YGAVDAYDVSVRIQTPEVTYSGHSLDRPRNIVHRREIAIDAPKHVKKAVGNVSPDDLAVVVDSVRLRPCAREINRCKHSRTEQKAMLCWVSLVFAPGDVLVRPHDISVAVDTLGEGEGLTRKIY